MVGFQSAVPFPAIVGQERLKRVLLAVAANDAIDGLLIRGEKGTAKSTAVRALVDLLPTQRAVTDCPYGCPPDEAANQCASCRARDDPPVETRPVPLVTVPLGATRERVVGSLSLTDALDGDPTFEPGLLAQANRGFLYVDEVNLLDDHLVDVVLDAAASGVNHVERDGVSETHPADFTLIGTMNPEEGDLRPQLRDRFALQVEVEGSQDLDERVAIVESAIERGQNESTEPVGAPDLERLQHTVASAQETLTDVTFPREGAETVAEVCVDAGVDGHRGDIAAARAARTFAALDGRSRVTEADIEAALAYALPHRLRSRPFEETEPLEDVLDDHFGDSDTADSSPDDGSGESEGSDRSPEETDDPSESGRDGGSADTDPTSGEGGSGSDESGAETDSERGADETPSDDRSSEVVRGGSAQNGSQTPTETGTDKTGDREEDEGNSEQNDEKESDGPDSERSARPPSTPAATTQSAGSSTAPELAVDEEATTDTRGGRTGRTEVEPGVEETGPRIRTEPAESAESVDIAASIRERAKRGQTDFKARDLSQSVRAGTATALVVFVVDASASMRPAMRAAKGTVLELLKESYQERDEVAFVAFAGEEANVLLPPTDSVSLAARHLKDLPTGDRTPLPAGLERAREVIDRADPQASVAVVVTDGRTNVANGSNTKTTREAAQTLGDRADEVLVVDASEPDDRATLVADLVSAAEGRVIPLTDLSRESVHSVSQSARQ
ncbi:VWA domain-containing protein [Halodesulfurarchaeum sp.]|uniref:VWA domain-containing protein n=1 Tax=Halodesulfurarchaeum sp. TaxID=1980530 RepID=UPI001BBEAD83|nr:VWA domain-containing protein [Halodesulfurarchaeum sp.]